MEKADIKRVIIAQKETTGNVSFVERDRRIREGILSSDRFVRIIAGVRRCGKSTLIEQIRGASGEKNYAINFDDNRLTGFNSDDFEKLYESFLELYDPEKTWYLDEIQNIEGWEKFIRRLHNQRHKVFITGSNARMLSADLGTHLTGRYIQSELFPFSFIEFLRFRKIPIENDTMLSPTKTTILKKAYWEYITTGGFPEYLLSRNSDYLKTLYENIIYRDIVARHNIKNTRTLVEMTHYLISNISKETSYTALKNTFGLSNAITVKEYIGYLEDCYLLFPVSKFDYSLKKQLVNPKKIYCVDPGLANSISFRFSENAGRQLENIIFLHLRRKTAGIYYHKNKYECDFIVVNKQKVIQAIQVCHTIADTETRDRELKGLLEAMENYKLDKGFIITDDEEETIEKNGFMIYIKPAWKFLLDEDDVYLQTKVHRLGS